ncbi:hypothetical protein VNO78_24715 [Psophocarpus tetragonolobus]|uniref:Uncharacterized protein n=1 Tax=Psophocarpus tetragonolobus TaxID=3891 RepID=A0AAN9XEQ5_PSOTE
MTLLPLLNISEKNRISWLCILDIYKRRMSIILSANMCSIANSKTVQLIKTFHIQVKKEKQSRNNTNIVSNWRVDNNMQHDTPSNTSSRRRPLIIGVAHSLVTLTYCLSPSMVCAEDEQDKGVIGAIESLFDPNEKTKSGKVLPKAYLKSAREVVKTLRESLNETSDDIAKFRRTADSAKESIREYLGSWRGNKTVAQEESYVILEKVIRSLANFYSKAGPSAPLSQEVKSEILDYLNTAEEFL